MSRSLVPCPHCGGQIAPEANFCRHCGSSDADGWGDETYDPEDDFDYEQFVEENFSRGSASTRIAPLWRFVAVVIVIALVASFVVPLL